MATSSILTNVVIKDEKQAEAFIEALEKSGNDSVCKISVSPIPLISSVEELRRFLKRNG